MAFRIRAATQDDADQVVAVVRAVYVEYGFTWEEGGYHADLYDLQAHYLDAGHAFFVAEQEGGAITGTCALELFNELPGQPGETVRFQGKTRVAAADCSLERLYVHPSARRQGIGHALLDRTAQEAKAAHRKRMELWSDKRFQDAHRLYLRNGAQIVGERICHDPDQSPEWGLLIPL